MLNQNIFSSSFWLKILFFSFTHYIYLIARRYIFFNIYLNFHNIYLNFNQSVPEWSYRRMPAQSISGFSSFKTYFFSFSEYLESITWIRLHTFYQITIPNLSENILNDSFIGPITCYINLFNQSKIIKCRNISLK